MYYSNLKNNVGFRYFAKYKECSKHKQQLKGGGAGQQTAEQASEPHTVGVDRTCQARANYHQAEQSRGWESCCSSLRA